MKSQIVGLLLGTLVAVAGCAMDNRSGNSIAVADLPTTFSYPPKSAVERSLFVTALSAPMRDGEALAVDVIVPGSRQPAPTIVSITPYNRHAAYNFCKQIALQGFNCLSADTRGRGDSTGREATFASDVNDTIDLIDWVTEQPFSNGQVAMMGSSYGGYNQWMAAAKGSEHLVTIAPGASVYPGFDFPMVNNVGYPYTSIWTGFTEGRSVNFSLFGDFSYWSEAFADALEQGVPFKDIDAFVGFDTPLYEEWTSHRMIDDYWKSLNPTSEEMAGIEMPILSSTGWYDGAQIGALRYYDEHMEFASDAGKEGHYLMIGPYEHAGVLFPTERVGGLFVPEAGGVDIPRLTMEWMAYAVLGAPRPSFLRDRVMFYVMGEGANEWRAAPSLEAMSPEPTAFFLAADGGDATSAGAPGLLSATPTDSGTIQYVYDPTDTSKAALGMWYTGDYALKKDDVEAIDGEGFVFETTPFQDVVEFIGAPRFEAMIGIDTPDTDFQLRVYEIEPDGTSIYLAESRARARHRLSPSSDELIDTSEPLPYTFDVFSMNGRRLKAGSKLRFVFGPPNSIYVERNYNAAKPVREQTPADAQTVTVTMLTGGENPATLYLPLQPAE
ncbi:MAG: CocE/NonD family hydrolase [Pseudomonadota bacterium]